MNFLFPIFLAGLAAFAVPWLLHRFNRENPPEQAFPSTQFLEATRVPVSRKKRLRHLGLFSLRALFLLAACLLFAQPYCSTDESRGESQRNTFVVIDRSASMQAAEHWSSAQAVAAESLAEARKTQSATSNQSNSVQLFDLTSELQAHGELSSELSVPNSVLNSLKPSFEKARYGVMMQRLDALALREELPVDVVFVTDAQQSNLPLQRRLLRTQNIDQFTLKKVGGDHSNLAVRATASTLDGVNVRVSAQALWTQSQTSKNETTSALLQIYLEDQVLASDSINLKSNQPLTVVLDNIVLPIADVNSVQIRISGDTDSLSIDSVVEVLIETVEPVKVGVRAFNMQSPEQPSLFINTALTTDGLARLAPTGANEARLSNEANHWVVFTPFTETGDIEVPNSVTEFVRNGGNVLLVLQPDTENDIAIESDFVGSIDDAHPIGLGEIDWSAVRVYSSASVTLSKNDRVLMRSGSGAPMLLERTLVNDSTSDAISSSGRLLIITDPLNGVSSDLPLQSAFVEWIARTVQWFDDSSAFPTQLDAGEAIGIPANAQVLNPAGQPLRSLSDSGSASRVQFLQPGIHTVVTSTSEHAINVKVPWSESNVVALDDEFITSWSNGELVSDVSDADEALSVSQESQTKAESSGIPWWPWLLPLLALSFMAESLLANRRLAVRRDGL